MIDMNDWLKSWDAYHTPAQTLSDGDVAWACLVGGGIMTLVFAVLAVVSFLRHGARGNPLVVSFAIGASAALFLCISESQTSRHGWARTLGFRAARSCSCPACHGTSGSWTDCGRAGAIGPSGIRGNPPKGMAPWAPPSPP